MLSGTAGDYTSSTVVGWETNSVSGFASALKAEYISHSDWNDYALGVTAKANLDVYLSSYIVNTHKEGDPLTKLNTFTQDISPILKAAGSSDEPIFIVNQIFDLAGNTGFRDGILVEGDLDGSAFASLSMDVKDAIVQDGLALSAGDDTGASAIDLVTNILRPSSPLLLMRKLRLRACTGFHLASGIQGKTPLAAYDLTITETEADDGFTYDAALLLRISSTRFVGY